MLLTKFRFKVIYDSNSVLYGQYINIGDVKPCFKPALQAQNHITQHNTFHGELHKFSKIRNAGI